MTKKKRELIDILLDNVKPEEWPEDAKYAAQDKYSAAHGKNKVMFYVYTEPKIIDREPHTYFNGQVLGDPIQLPDLCKHWNKTIVHRDEFMKRWNGLNRAVDSEGWIQWNGGEMPVEKGTLIDVKYRSGLFNMHVKAGEHPSGGSIPSGCAIDFKHDDNQGDIIAYRLHVPREQKTPQQLALEKFGTDWHENEGVQPVSNEVLIDAIVDGVIDHGVKMERYTWNTLGLFEIKKWRIHSDQAALLREPIPPCSEEILCHFVDVKEKKYLDKVDGEFVGIEKVIADRGSNYGRFEDGAEIMQQLKLIAHTSQGWERMKPVQREAMDMILHKIGRILNGDPAYVDSWVDIEGYSNLVSSWLKGESK